MHKKLQMSKIFKAILRFNNKGLHNTALYGLISKYATKSNTMGSA